MIGFNREYHKKENISATAYGKGDVGSSDEKG